MTNEAMPKLHDNRVTRLPIYDPESNDMLPGYLEVDVEFFLSSVRGLRSNQARIVQFKDTEYPDPTPKQEMEIIDRIISGLPMVAVDQVQVIVEDYMEEQGVKLFDVASLYPQEVKLEDLPEPTWSRIPEFENYEVNQLGVVRSRWTRRDLEVISIGDERYVEMHDKDGFPHNVNIRLVLEWTYGK